MKIKIEITDSHRNLSNRYWERLGRFYSENVVDMDKEEATCFVKDLFLEYEAEYGVKWFEIQAFVHQKLAGSMRVLRNPEDRTKWYFCDVQTGKVYRKNGIATKMYESAIELVRTFYAAECVEASVSAGNKESVLLHKKMGFKDTERKSSFANFGFKDDETIYEHVLLTEYELQNTDEHRALLKAYFEENGINGEPEEPENVILIFCGERAVGYKRKEIRL